MHATRTWFVVVLVAFFFGPDTLRAQPLATPEGGPAEAVRSAYERAAELGFDEFEAGNYAEARARFLEAEALYENAGILRALAKVEYELRRYPASITFAERALASTERPLRAAQRADTERLLSMARGYVGRYRITLIPPEATLLLDGSEVERDPSGILYVPVGPHTLEARAAHHHAERRTVQVLGSENVALTLALAERDEPRAEGTPLRRKWWLWTGVAAIATGLTVGLVLGLRDPQTERYETSSGAVITIPTMRESR